MSQSQSSPCGQNSQTAPANITHHHTPHLLGVLFAPGQQSGHKVHTCSTHTHMEHMTTPAAAVDQRTLYWASPSNTAGQQPIRGGDPSSPRSAHTHTHPRSQFLPVPSHNHSPHIHPTNQPTWLHRQHVTLLQLLRHGPNIRHIMHVQAQKVTQAVGHEQLVNTRLQQTLNT